MSNVKVQRVLDTEQVLPASLRFLVETYKEINVRLDPIDRTIWCTLGATGIPCITPEIIQELTTLREHAKELFRPENDPAIIPKFFVLKSSSPNIFSLGGDLQLFVKCIKSGDAEALREYARNCIRLVFDIHQSLGVQILTVCLVQGDALGGGFEAALSFNVLVAERGTKMGLPESLFNAFPGMGAYSLLSRKIGHIEAERMIVSGKIFQAEELHEMGIVSILAERGRGEETVRKFIRENQERHALLLSINKVRQRVVPISYEELEEVCDIWVDNALALSPRSLHYMELLAQMQQRRLNVQREAAAHT